MFLTIFLIALALVALAAWVMARAADDRIERNRLRLIATGITGCWIIVLFLCTFTLVKAVEVGVPVSFGHVGDPIGPGVHFVAPWTGVETYPTRPLNEDVRVQVRTADAGRVTVTTTARWKVSVTSARELYFQVRTGDEKKIGEQVVQRNLAQAIGDVYNVVPNVASTARVGRAEAIKARLATLVAPYGIDITAIQLRGIEPDPTTAQSIADFAAQQRKTQIATEANNTATKDAIRRLTEANGYRAAARRLAGLTPTQAQLLCVQEWSKAVAAGAQLYTQPCAGTAPLVTTNK